MGGAAGTFVRLEVLAFEPPVGLRLYGEVGVSGSWSSIMTCSVLPSGVVSIAMTGLTPLEPAVVLPEPAGFVFEPEEGGTLLEPDIIPKAWIKGKS